MYDVAVTILLSFITAVTIYWVGGGIGAKGKKTEGKLAPYACGESFPASKLQVNVEDLFLYAMAFLIFDVLAFILAMSMFSPKLSLAYVLVALLTAGALALRD